MGRTTSGECVEISEFFFAVIHTVRDTFQAVYDGRGSVRPHSAEYRNFSEAWGMEKVIFEMADNSLTKVARVKQEYLTDFLTFLTYLIQKGEMEEAEDKWQEARRKAMRHR